MGLFGSVPIDCSLLAKRIVESVRGQNLPLEGKGSDTARVQAVKVILEKIGHELQLS